MDFKPIFDLLDNSTIPPKTIEGILDFVPSNSPHQKIGEVYDKTSEFYDNYMTGNSLFLKIVKKVALGVGGEATEQCIRIVKKMTDQLKNGIVLDIPAGTGIFAFDEYVKHPGILFVAAEYSLGMLKKAQERIKKLGAKNITLIRADVGALPFKDGIFDAVLCLNGIHSFSEKEKAVMQIARVLKQKGKFYGSLVLRGERWLTDFVLETFYYRQLWFTRPALTRQEFFSMLDRNGLQLLENKLIKALAIFDAVKSETSNPVQ